MILSLPKHNINSLRIIYLVSLLWLISSSDLCDAEYWSLEITFFCFLNDGMMVMFIFMFFFISF